MPEITFAESSRHIQELMRVAEDASRTGSASEAIDAWRVVLAHPCAHHQVLGYEILDEIHQEYRRAGHYQEAIAAKRDAIAAGYRSVPDPEADIAECLLEAGRRDEADRLYAQLRERDPDDVWLYNSAALSYLRVDARQALRWSLDGIDVAITTGDPDQVITQLLDWARDSWTALDEPIDQTVVDRVETFSVEWKPPHTSRTMGDATPPIERACAHCGWDPEILHPPARTTASGSPVIDLFSGRGDHAAGSAPRERVERPMPIALAWFPGSDWSDAIRRWPDLLDDLPADHVAYSHEIEARTKRISHALAGHRPHIAPLTINGLVEHAAKTGAEPGTAEARSAYAAELLRQGHAVPWPPGRNQPCWCGSGRKYKQCCGPVPASQSS